MRKYRYKRNKSKLFLKNKSKLFLKFVFIFIILSVDYFCIKKIITYDNSKETSIVVNASQKQNKPTKNSSNTSSSKNNSNNDELKKDFKKANNNEENNNSTNGNTSDIDNSNNTTIKDNINTNNNSKQNVINNPNISNKEFFKDSIFLGDSITEAISFYDILNESNVVSKKGLSIPYAKSQVDKVISISPKNVFILLGENDLNSVSNQPSKVVSDYKQMVKRLKNNLPNSKIYTLSALTIAKTAEQKHPGLSRDRILEFNNNLKNMSRDLNVSYIDITSILGEDEKFLEPDGVHPKCSFYSEMLSHIRACITNNK